MKTLIVGIGALGGVIGARLLSNGIEVCLAARDTQSANRLKDSGLQVTGIGGDVSVEAPHVGTLHDFTDAAPFDIVILATKAHEAVEVAPGATSLLSPGGVLLPLQNGSVPRILADHLGVDRVLGCLSNIGATMNAPGTYEQRNAGNLLIGELDGGVSARVESFRDWLVHGIEVRTTENFPGAVWSKLLLNCSVTTIGAIAGQPMRRYIETSEGRLIFTLAYDEALAIAMANDIQPEPMLVDSIPPGWDGRSVPGSAYDAWVDEVVNRYGDLKPSMLQDFERNRPTEVEFINGYIVDLGQKRGIPTPVNAAIVETVRAIERGQLAPSPTNLIRLKQAS